MRCDMQNQLNNLWGPVQDEDVRHFFENDYHCNDDIALNQALNFFKLRALCSWTGTVLITSALIRCLEELLNEVVFKQGKKG